MDNKLYTGQWIKDKCISPSLIHCLLSQTNRVCTDSPALFTHVDLEGEKLAVGKRKFQKFLIEVYQSKIWGHN